MNVDIFIPILLLYTHKLLKNMHEQSTVQHHLMNIMLLSIHLTVSKNESGVKFVIMNHI